jgi:hypothetical protein
MTVRVTSTALSERPGEGFRGLGGPCAPADAGRRADRGLASLDQRPVAFRRLVRAPRPDRQPQEPAHWHEPPDWHPHPQPDPQPQAPSRGNCLILAVVLAGCVTRSDEGSFRVLVDVGVSDIIALLGWAAVMTACVPATQ